MYMTFTFIASLSIVMTPRMSCFESVRRVQSYCSQHKLPVPSGSSSAYCQARNKLCIGRLIKIHKQVSQALLKRTQNSWLGCGREVRVVAGTGIRLPDTSVDQDALPQTPVRR